MTQHRSQPSSDMATFVNLFCVAQRRSGQAVNYLALGKALHDRLGLDYARAFELSRKYAEIWLLREERRLYPSMRQVV